MSEWYSVVDQPKLELLQDLATGAKLLRRNPSGLDLELDGVRRTTSHSSGKLRFLLDIAFVQGLADGDPVYPVAITAHGRAYVDGGYWFSGLRPGKLTDGRWAISTPSGPIDVNDAVRGLEGRPDIGRVLMSHVISLAQ